MKKIISIFLCTAMLFSCMIFAASGVSASATVYYVDSISGDDSNSGTSESQAWRTMARASEQEYQSGDRLLFKAGGVYTGRFVAQGNGTAEQPIVVSAYGDIERDGKPLLYNRGQHEILFYIHNVNGWTVENLEFTAPDSRGMSIIADNGFGIMKDITVKNCTFHNIWYHETEQYGSDHAAINIRSSGKYTRIENVTLCDLNIYDCAYGINTHGNTLEWSRDIFISPEESYNQNFVFERISLNNIFYDAIIIGSINRLHINDCSLINTSLNTDHYTAPMWSHHAKNMLIENCEIAGATNYKDGMAVDFDGWTTDSTYQYIYSHDNIRFINNCVYDDQTKNANCTVRYCLSVNDNKGNNSFANLLTTPAYDYSIENDKPVYMDNFKFYNNTIINGSSFDIKDVRNSYVANNIFYGDDLSQEFKSKRVSTHDDTGKKYLREFTGEFTNNCFYGCSIPMASKNSTTVDPKFVGDDLTDKNSFMLSSESKLIGRGIKVEDDMGERDFYGNPLTDSHNIGCYEGSGIDVEDSGIQLARFIKHVFQVIFGYFAHIISDISRSF